MNYNAASLNKNETPNFGLPISQSAFCRAIGRSPVTVWRWQKLGWLDKPVNIAGRPYLTPEAVERFMTRARAGEFAQPSNIGKRGATR